MNKLHLPDGIETPPKWGVWIGEAAHNLRSSLDNLLCQLVIRRHPKSGWRRCQQEKAMFPIYLYGPRTMRRGKPGQRFTRDKSIALGKLMGLRNLARVKRYQPYHRRNGLGLSPLWLLHELNNADKHNLIVIAGGFSAGTALHPVVGSVVHLTDSGVYIEPSAKAQVEAARSKVDVYAKSFYEITFGEGCDATQDLPVIQTLSRIADEVSRIVEDFADQFS